jgi:hypothetical protein
VFWANITHNLTQMASEAGIYEPLWRPEETGIERAAQLIAPLREGLALLESDPERFKAFNASNGWGVYGNLVEFVRKYLEACEAYPDAHVYASRTLTPGLKNGTG